MRYFLAFLVALGLIFALFLLLFGGSSSPKHAAKTLDSYASTNAVARLTIDGPINSDQNHQAVRISVSNTDVTFEQIQGYQGNVVNLQTYASNEAAYTNFLLSLAHAGFNRGTTANPNLKDERGFCPLGDRFVFEFTQDGKELERYWVTSCGGSKTYLGDANLTLALFKAQVPNYNGLIENIIF